MKLKMLLVVSCALTGCTLESSRIVTPHMVQIWNANQEKPPTCVVEQFFDDSLSGRYDSAVSHIGATTTSRLEPRISRPNSVFREISKPLAQNSDGYGRSTNLPNQSFANNLRNEWPRLIHEKRISLGKIEDVREIGDSVEVKAKLFVKSSPFGDARFIIEKIGGSWKIVAIWVP